MEAQTLPDVVGFNVVAEIKGSTLPNETVLVSGHLDSWDVGQGKYLFVLICRMLIELVRFMIRCNG